MIRICFNGISGILLALILYLLGILLGYVLKNEQ